MSVAPAPTASNRAADLTPAIHAYLTGAGGSSFNGAPVEIIAAWEGDDHLLWRVESRGREAVVKLFLDAGQARSRRQFDGHTLMYSLGLAPAPLWVDRYPEGLARQVMAYSWVEGRPLAADDDANLDALAEAVAQLHTTPFEAVRRFSPHPLNLETYWRIEAAGCRQILEWLPGHLHLAATIAELARAADALVQAALPLWQTTPPAPVHGDLRLEHALVPRGGAPLTLVDWEMFGLGDPALDVARFHRREGHALSLGAWERWFRRYLHIAAQDGLDARIAVYAQLLPLADTAYLLNGLRTHSHAGIAPELAAVLPDIGAALVAALEVSTTALALAPAQSIETQVSALLDHLLPPTAPSRAAGAHAKGDPS